jgi:hypothetical protein
MFATGNGTVYYPLSVGAGGRHRRGGGLTMPATIVVTASGVSPDEDARITRAMIAARKTALAITSLVFLYLWF